MFTKITQYLQENACVGVSFNKVVSLQACNYITKGTPTQVFPVKYAKIFKNTFFEKHRRTAASLSHLLGWGKAKKITGMYSQ